MKFRNLALIVSLTTISITIMGVTKKHGKINKTHPALSFVEKRLVGIENISSPASNGKFEYDEVGRLVSVDWNETRTEYKYQHDTLLSSTWNKDRAKKTEFIRGDFSEQGYLGEYERWYILSGDTTKTSGRFEYNEEGMLEMQAISFKKGDEWQKFYEYEQENLVAIRTFKNSKPVSVTTWEYTDKADMLKIDFNRFYDAAFNITGPSNKNLPSRKLVVSPKGRVLYDAKYTYEYDNSGYIVSRTTTSADNMFESTTEKFTYNK